MSDIRTLRLEMRRLAKLNKVALFKAIGKQRIYGCNDDVIRKWDRICNGPVNLSSFVDISVFGPGAHAAIGILLEQEMSTIMNSILPEDEKRTRNRKKWLKVNHEYNLNLMEFLPLNDITFENWGFGSRGHLWHAIYKKLDRSIWRKDDIEKIVESVDYMSQFGNTLSDRQLYAKSDRNGKECLAISLGNSEWIHEWIYIVRYKPNRYVWAYRSGFSEERVLPGD